LIIFIAGELTRNLKRPTISFLLDYHSKGRQLVETMPDLKAANPECGPFIGSLGFEDDKVSEHLQAADLVAGVCKEYGLNKLGKMSGDPTSNNAALLKILGNRIGVAVLDSTYFANAAKASAPLKGAAQYLLHSTAESIRILSGRHALNPNGQSSILLPSQFIGTRRVRAA
jgi:hypothetical protein